MIKDFNLLKSTINWLLKDRNFHLCIHDLSGILHQNPDLQIPQINTIHSCNFCECAKSTTTGLRFCLKCKELSLKKALKEKRMFTGQCYLGITEIIKPIFYNDKPLCVVYLGNITLKENTSAITQKIKKTSYITGIRDEALFKSLITTEIIDASMLCEYAEIVEIISNCIVQTITDQTKLHRKSVSTLPSYRTTNHWVIELLQNYILSYYNRDLQLSQLAKLYFLNPEYLCRLFKKETGTSFCNYVNTVRINKAKKLLTLTKSNVVDVAIDVGYKNVTYFNRLFKRYTGITPCKYRSQQLHTS